MVREHHHFSQGLLQALQQIAASQQQIAASQQQITVSQQQSVDLQTKMVESLQQLAAKASRIVIFIFILTHSSDLADYITLASFFHRFLSSLLTLFQDWYFEVTFIICFVLFYIFP